MKFLAGSTLQKVLAALVAAIMSFSILTPAVKKPATNTKPTGIVHNVKKVDGKIVSDGPKVKEETGMEIPDVPEDDYVEEDAYAPQEAGDNDAAPVEEEAAPEAPVEEEAAPVEEEAAPQAPVEEEAPAEEAAPQAIAEWDVSATEEDDVHMYFFTEVAGAVRALFVPITAYAATDGYTDPNPDGSDTADPNAPAPVTLDVDAQGVHKDGTLIIEGTGSTDSMLFMNLIEDFDKFGVAYESWYDTHVIHPGETYVLKTNIDGEGYVKDGCSAATKEEAYVGHTRIDGTVDYKALFEDYYPYYILSMVLETENFWGMYGKFVPTEVVFNGEIDTIGFAAFAFVPSITSVTFEKTVKNVGAGAFAGSNIETVTFADGIETIGALAFSECYNLKTVYIPASLSLAENGYIGNNAFTDMAEDSVIYFECANFNNGVALYFRDYNDANQAEVGEGEEEEVFANYDFDKTDILQWVRTPA